MLTTNVMASRTGGRGVFSGNRGKGSYTGMTLQDYAAGGAWGGSSGFGAASTTTGQSRQL